jgi:hypothetical protein
LEGSSVIDKDAPILAALAKYDKKWAASGHYDMRGITSGVIKERGGAPKIEVGLCAVDFSFNSNISWICTKQDNLSNLLEAVYPDIPGYLEAEVLELQEVSLVFCSHANFLKCFSVWTSSELQLVFTTSMVRKKQWRDWVAQSMKIDHAQLGGIILCALGVSV